MLPATLLLQRRDVIALLSLDECIAAVEAAFRLHAEGRSLAPGVLGVRARASGFHIKAAGLELSRPYFAAKANANFSGNPERDGLPAIQGVIVLCDAGTGAPLAVMDSIEITILRTGAATAVAARHLALSDAREATIVGCGNQGRVQLRALSRVRRLERVHVLDAAPARAERFATEMSAELGIEVRAADDLPAAVHRSQICVTCTPARRAFLARTHVAPGTFVAAVGADNEDKQELEAGLFAESTIVVDNLEQCATIGDLHHALEAGIVTRDHVHAELGEILVGHKRGRAHADEIMVFDSTGTAIQDVAAAAAVYEKALTAGRGEQFRFGE
jgi:alanine dehydrogenase